MNIIENNIPQLLERVPEVNEISFERAEGVVMYGLLANAAEDSMSVTEIVMDKGDRRKKKLEKKNGTRPPKGPGSKGSGRNDLDTCMPYVALVENSSFEVPESVEVVYEVAVLSGTDTVMKKMEKPKSKNKEHKNSKKRKQKQQIGNRG